MASLTEDPRPIDAPALADCDIALYSRLQDVLQDKQTMDAVASVITGRFGASLRQLDWLVTNFSKRVALRVTAVDGRSIYVHDEYKSCLGVYRRRSFDPFCRAARKRPDGTHTDHAVTLYIDAKNTARSTLAQLNFLCWAHANGVLQYTARARATIEADMLKTTRASRVNRHAHGKRSRLTAAPVGRCQAYRGIRRVRL